MSYLHEEPQWESGIYQLEITDPIQGGPDGIANLQAKQLANRTKFLKAEVERVDAEIGTLDTDLSNAKTVLDNIVAYNPALFAHALSIYWEHSDAQPKIELFGENFELHQSDEFTITSMISDGVGDDSVDISDTSELVIGDYYLMTGGGEPDEVIRVKEILTGTRFLMYGVAAHTRYSGVMKQVSGTKDFGSCTFLNEGVYLTRSFPNESWGRLVDIYFKHSNGGEVKLFVSDQHSDFEWVEVTDGNNRSGSTSSIQRTEIVDAETNTVTVGYRVPIFNRYQFKLSFEFNSTDHPLVTDIELHYFYIKNVEGSDILNDATQYILNNIPIATLESSGLVQLSNSFTSNDETKAATELAVSDGINTTVAQTLDAMYIKQPGILTPSAGATSVSTTPSLSATPYANIYAADTRVQRVFEVDLATGNFVSPVYTHAGNTDAHTVTSALSIDTTYKWRCRDEATSGKASFWSLARSFSTGSVSIATPTMQVEGFSSSVPEQPTLQGSSFSMSSGVDTHYSTDWVIETPGGVIVWESINDTLNKTNILVPFGVLSQDTSYVFKMRYTGMSFGASGWASVTVTTIATFFDPSTTPIGSPAMGGYYAGIMEIRSMSNGPTYALIVAPKASGETTATWGPDYQPMGYNDWDGLSNTYLMPAGTHPAADFCKGLSIGGFTDWYLPAVHELDQLYFNLKPTADNSTATHQNNDVPVGRPYQRYSDAADYPPQTSVTIFQEGNSEAFQLAWYYSSSAPNNSTWQCKRFQFQYGGIHATGGRTGTSPIRAVRRIMIS